MLHTIKPAPGSKKLTKRIARGNSGKGGTTGGRGTKGHYARTGTSRNFRFEGGQTPLVRRQPKLGGFRNPNRIEYAVINLDVLEANLDAGTYTGDDLRAFGLASLSKPVKILGQGTVSKKFDITVEAASKSAIAAIEKAGGSVKLV